MTKPARPQDLFAADSDVAALVYAPGDDPDGTLRRFISDVSATGGSVAGLLQRRRAVGAPVTFTLLPGAGPIGDGAPCAQALSAAAPALMEAVRHQPDLLVLSRFGSAELAGGGLLGVLIEAVRRGIPVLIAVPQALFDEWLDFSDGLTVRLDNDADSLNRWWVSLATPPRVGAARTICEQVK